MPLQRLRLLRAAVAEFSEHGYARGSADAISHRAGMSKATFYEHFANKEECILAAFDMAAEVVGGAMVEAAGSAVKEDARGRIRAAIRAFLTALAEHPDYAKTLLVEAIAAGPRAAGRRDEIVQGFAQLLDTENAAAASRGLIGRFASPYDAFAIAGAVAELASRQVRLGDPADVLDLEPVIDRLITGVLSPRP